jgi:hypothetical protein
MNLISEIAQEVVVEVAKNRVGTMTEDEYMILVAGVIVRYGANKVCKELESLKREDVEEIARKALETAGLATYAIAIVPFLFVAAIYEMAVGESGSDHDTDACSIVDGPLFYGW